MSQTGQAYATYLSNNYGIRFGPQSLWRAPGTIPGETGEHANGNTMDVPVEPNSSMGAKITADAHKNGFYVYQEPAGTKGSTGPHLHIVTSRNPDGSQKAGK